MQYTNLVKRQQHQALFRLALKKIFLHSYTGNKACCCLIITFQQAWKQA